MHLQLNFLNDGYLEKTNKIYTSTISSFSLSLFFPDILLSASRKAPRPLNMMIGTKMPNNFNFNDRNRKAL